MKRILQAFTIINSFLPSAWLSVFSWTTPFITCISTTVWGRFPKAKMVSRHLTILEIQWLLKYHSYHWYFCIANGIPSPSWPWAWLKLYWSQWSLSYRHPMNWHYWNSCCLETFNKCSVSFSYTSVINYIIMQWSVRVTLPRSSSYTDTGRYTILHPEGQGYKFKSISRVDWWKKKKKKLFSNSWAFGPYISVVWRP